MLSCELCLASYRCYYLGHTTIPAGAKVEPKAIATLLPNVKDREKGAEVFSIMSKSLHDDKAAFEFLCPQQVCMPSHHQPCL